VVGGLAVVIGQWARGPLMSKSSFGPGMVEMKTLLDKH